MACSLAHATAYRLASACGVASCMTGFGDCNRTTGDGCETDLSSNASHCGACGNACSPGRTCTSGICSTLPVTVTFSASGTGATGTLQSWTVPAGVTRVTVEAWGAQGGSGAIYGTSVGAGGRGAYVRGTLTVTPGSVLDILVGQAGGSSGGPHGNENGGGGGSFVVERTGDLPLIIAGGGGAPASTYGVSCTRTPASADGQAGTAGVSVSGSSAATGGTHCSPSLGGRSYMNGGAGGAGNTATTPTTSAGTAAAAASSAAPARAAATREAPRRPTGRATRPSAAAAARTTPTPPGRTRRACRLATAASSSPTEPCHRALAPRVMNAPDRPCSCDTIASP